MCSFYLLYQHCSMQTSYDRCLEYSVFIPMNRVMKVVHSKAEATPAVLTRSAPGICASDAPFWL